MPTTVYVHPQANRQIQLGSHRVSYVLKRGKRRTIGFSVGPDGLSVSAPRWTGVGEVELALQEKAGWIVSKLGLSRERAQRMEEQRIVWQNGCELPFLGEQIRLELDATQTQSQSQRQLKQSVAQPQADEQGHQRVLKLGLPLTATATQIRDAANAWLMRQAKRVFVERMEHFAPQVGVRYTKLSLSSADTRWGSASANGHIRLNWRLIHLGLQSIDYVVVHELSHLRVMDHSPQFWGVVGSVMPDYAERRKALKQSTALGHE